MKKVNTEKKEMKVFALNERELSLVAGGMYVNTRTGAETDRSKRILLTQTEE